MTMTKQGSIASVLAEGQKQAFGYDTVAVRFIKQCPQGNLGETVNKSSSVARSLVDRGLAEYFIPPRHIAATQRTPLCEKKTILALLKMDGSMSTEASSKVSTEASESSPTKESEFSVTKNATVGDGAFGPTKEQVEQALLDQSQKLDTVRNYHGE